MGPRGIWLLFSSFLVVAIVIPYFPQHQYILMIVSCDRSSLRYRIFTQSIDAIDVTSVTQSPLNSINAIDVTRCWLNVKCSNVPMFQCSNVEMFKCSNVPMFQCSNTQMFKCSNVQMFKCQMSIRLNFCRSVPTEFFRSFLGFWRINQPFRASWESTICANKVFPWVGLWV